MTLVYFVKRWQVVLPWISFLTLTVFLGLLIFKNIGNLGFEDWDSHYSQSEFTRVSIYRFRQLPLWNPYHCGGMTQIGNPQDDSLNPLGLFTLVLGPVVGYKILFLIYFFLGLWVFYHLSLYFKTSPLGALFSSCFFVLSLTLLTFAVGETTFFSLTLIPYTYLFYLKAAYKVEFKFILLTSVTLFAILLTGYISVVQVIFFLFICSLLTVLSERSLKSLKVFLLIFLLFLGFSAVKLFPATETLVNYPRYVRESFSGYSLKSLYNSMFSRKQLFESVSEWGSKTDSFLNGQSWGLEENGMYVGLLSLCLFVIGMISKKAKFKKELLLLLIFFLYLSFGLNITPSLYRVIQTLPVFNYIRIAQRYRYFFMIPYILFVGFGFDTVWGFVRNKRFRILLGLVTIFAVIDVFKVNTELLTKSFPYNAKSIVRSSPFVHVCSPEVPAWSTENPNEPFSNEYVSVLSNQAQSGSCFEPLSVMDHTTCSSSQNYRGEVFFLNSEDKVKSILWSPNNMIIYPISYEDDVLVINQNFDRGWRVEIDGKVRNVKKINGLLSVPVPQGTKKVEFYYLPTSFLTGVTISILSLIAVIFFLRYNRA